MGFHLLRLIVIIPIVVSAGNSDSTSFLSDGLLFSDIGFSSSSIEEALAFRQPDFSLDSLDSSSDGFDSPFENTNGNFFSTDTVVGLEDTDNSDLLLTNYVDLNDKDNSDFFLIHNTDFEDEPIQMTDCSSSKPSPIIGKSRIRRQDASSDVCPAPGPGPFKSQGVPSDAAGGRPRTSHLDNFSLEWVLTEAEFRKRQNEACNIFTAGTLPWGLCYQPTEVPLQPAGTSVVPPDVRGSPYTSYMVDPGTLVSGSTKFCPTPDQIFYCCMQFLPDNIPRRVTADTPPTESTDLPASFEFTGQGIICVPLLNLMES